jgi:hypothetical protein
MIDQIDQLQGRKLVELFVGEDFGLRRRGRGNIDGMGLAWRTPRRRLLLGFCHAL